MKMIERKLLQIARIYHQTCLASYARISTGLDRRGNKQPFNKAEADRIKYECKFELQWIKDVESFDPNGFKPSEINKAVKQYRESL